MCDAPCLPGTFGKNCGGTCENCSVQYCNPFYGCLNAIETTYQGAIHNSNNQSENELSIFGTSTANYTEDQIPRSSYVSTFKFRMTMKTEC
ncbi:uncharacterized protein LOC144622836 isoform X2 [Crassostrea virginica]